MENLEDIIFYSIDSTIKTYRQFAQRNIIAAGLDMTVDQWLIMKAIDENNELKQNEIAEKVFKDAASVTRIIDLMIKKGFLSRQIHTGDRRRTHLILTKTGKETITKAQSIINKNRATALTGISKSRINELREVLLKIKSNCQIN